MGRFLGPGKALTAGESSMASFCDQYRHAFSNLGSPLKPRDGISHSALRAAEKRLGESLPKALADYYLVAGREQRFNCVYERLLPPEEWFVDGYHLVFMEENQAVVYWGVQTCREPTSNAPVFQGVNGDPITWHVEHERCATFLLVMLHWQGAFGGAMPWCGTAPTSRQLVTRLDRDWRFVGEVNGMRAYSRPGQAACILLWENSWRVFCGATEAETAKTLAKELRVSWDDPGNLVTANSPSPS